MIIPTLWIERRVVSGNDIHGQPKIGTPTREKVCPVKLIFDAQHTTVRTDSSASNGHAYEMTANIVLLATVRSKIEIDDILTVLGKKVVVAQKHPRYRAGGQLDHFEIRCTAWVG